MPEVIKIRDIVAKPGEKAYGFLKIAENSTDIVKIPIEIVNGSKGSSPKLCLTGGVHCTEYEGIEAITRIFHEINPEDLSGALISCPVVNTPGFQRVTHYVNPLDGMNLNRVYPGNPEGTISEKMIDVIFNELIRLCDYYIDLHGGEPYEDMGQFVIYSTGVGTKEIEVKSAEMARYYLPNVIQTFEGKDGTSSAEVARVGIPSITPQAGALALYREEDIQFHVRGVKNVMKWLGMLPGPPEEPKKDIPTFINNYYVRVKKGGIFYPLLRGEDPFKKGDVMGVIKDLFGNVIEEIIAPKDGMVCYYFPKRVKVAGDPAYSMWVHS
ncbi:MAG: succinylglutamate desuccinylase/aspartoacylase family protein [Promethearchaeota archaeon]